MAWYSFLDYVFGSLLPLGPFWAIFILALFVSVLITLVYKYMTNQQLMKEMKEKQKESQNKIKELKDKPEEMMRMQKEMMKQNFEYMKHSFKSTFITMIPVLLIFGWMAAIFSYEPIYPGETFSITAEFLEEVKGQAELVVDLDQGTELIDPAKQEIKEGKASWKLKSIEGGHLLRVKTDTQEQSKKVLITKELKTEPATDTYLHSDIKSIKIDYKLLKPLGGFEIFGWKPGWLGIYIILSLIFSLALRKVLNVY